MYAIRSYYARSLHRLARLRAAPPSPRRAARPRLTLPDERGRVLLPSIVRYRRDGGCEVGYAAQAHQAVDPKNTIVSVKRFMGRGLSDIEHIENAPYDS